MPMIGGSRSDFQVETPTGNIGASKKSTWGDSWTTSKDNQDFKIYLADGNGHVQSAYVTQDQGKQLQALARDGATIRSADGRQVIVGSGVGSESLPTGSGVMKGTGIAGGIIGEQAEGVMVDAVAKHRKQLDDAMNAK